MASKTLLIAVVMVSVIGTFTVNSRSSEADDVQRWIVGMAGSCADITDWWHSDEGEYTTRALDLVKCSGTTAGEWVYYQSYGYIAADIHVYLLNHQNGYNYCRGVEAEIYDNVYGWYLGGVHYVHIHPGQGVIGDDFVASSAWNIEFLGTIESTPASNCPWTNVHFHQSNRHAWPFRHNTGIEDPIDPTGSASSNWLHALQVWW